MVAELARVVFEYCEVGYISKVQQANKRTLCHLQILGCMGNKERQIKGTWR